MLEAYLQPHVVLLVILFIGLLLLLYPLKLLLQKYHTPSNNESPDVLNKGLTNIKHLFYLQVVSKLITFQFNTAVARLIDPSIYGVSNMQIQLLLNIILPISREGFRRAALRGNHDASGKEKQEIFSFSYWSIPLGLVSSVSLGALFLSFSSDEENSMANYRETIMCVIFASFLQILVEPLFIQTQRMLLFQTIAIIDLLATVIKCFVSFTFIIFLNYGVLSFGYAEIFYSLGMIFGYLVYFKLVAKEPIFPERFTFNVSLVTYWLMFEWQTLQKLLLQEGEKIVLKTMVPLVKQGSYAVVSILGAIATRFLFQWVEEGMFPVFSMLTTKLNEEKDQETKKSILLNMLEVLGIIIKLNILLGLCFATFGPNFSYLLLHIIYGEKYSSTSAPIELSWMCFYLLLIGINGILEAFSQSSGDSRTLMILNIAMGLQSVVSIFMNIGLLSYNVVAGSMITSCFITVIRMLFNIWTIRKLVYPILGDKQWIKQSIPHVTVLLSFSTSYVITYFSEIRLCSSKHGFSIFKCGSHVAIGGLFFLLTLFMIYVYELSDLKQAYDLIRNKRVKSEQKEGQNKENNKMLVDEKTELAKKND